MDHTRALFLDAIRCALRDEAVAWDDVPPDQLTQVLDLAKEHHVLPLIFEAVHSCPAATQADPQLIAACRRATVQAVMTQTMKTEEFLELYRHLRDHDVKPLVVKGLICRSLYPRPDCRFSGDEDVLCGDAQFLDCHKAMIGFGMEPCSSRLDSYEVPYRKEDSTLYIELHKTLFSQDSDVFNDCNRFFEDSFSRAVEVPIQGQPIWTMCPTDHMLYLIVHAFKHFLHSGFGIRQVCDMVLFAMRWGQDIDWRYIHEKCRSIRCDRFATALFRIGERHLDFDPEKAHYPHFWNEEPVDETALLEDLLDGGIYGSSDRSRVHSSNMTLNAVSDDKKGKKAKRSILRTVFPSAKSIEGRFPYLRRKPYLLPVAWTCRIFGYAKESITDPDSGASEVIRTGSKRIELLRHYDIID